CPLAFFAQIPVRLKRPGIKKASPWLEANYYYVSFAVFFFSLWMRLIATNGDGHAISAFFVMIAFAALIFGAFYTGKTWCNYICPLSFIEKIYTEPHGLRETQNSQCAKCTACKKLCPDINEENGYWKEIASNPKRFVYFAFPGVVFGFYFYYFMQSGTWSYYFGTPEGVRWVNEPKVIHWAFMPGNDAETAGFFFLPVVPRAVAAILTLAVCALATYFLLRWAEKYVGAWLKHRDAETDDGRVRHVMFSIAAFLAFITFYSFAGAPTLWKAPWIVPQLFIITVVLTATLFLARRLRRTQKTFAEETLAKNIIKRWEWTDITLPKDLREAFLIHTIKTRESAKGFAQVLEIYKDAVRETLANGFVTREEVQLLESLRNQLQIKKSDHDKVMEALAEEERAMLSDPSKQISAEKRLQLETYEHALRSYLEGVFASDSAPDDRLITQLRSEYRVTRNEHAAVLDEILGGSQGIAARLAEEISSIERAAKTIQALELQPTPTHNFLMALLRRRRARALDRLMRGLSFTLQEEEGQTVRAALLSSDDMARKSVIESLSASVTPVIAERLATAYRETAAHEASMPTLTDMLIARTRSVDPYVRAVSLYALGERGAANPDLLERLGADEHEVVRETAQHLAARAQSGEGEGHSHAGLITIEKMIALRSAPIFSTIAPEGLAELARACREDEYAPSEALCLEGEPGNEVFILLAGDVRVLKNEGAGERLVATEKAGGFIGEMAVLDPAPRSATLRAGADGVRVLRLDGTAFRTSLNNDSTIASSVIRTLAQRLRQK
ncbi:MAG TPA: cyclic nucleotide-binding domain-containing protein, partial [Pyrinomonadaceae bacterium]|nr:cyclic nucleotide-binding domain-containing protein [Pyrinomonadaceae bacterium]